jgi:hypothetical protein
MFHDLCSIPPVAGSSKNHETPFREEIGLEALRTNGIVLFFQIPPKNRCGIFGSGTPERKCALGMTEI